MTRPIALAALALLAAGACGDTVGNVIVEGTPSSPGSCTQATCPSRAPYCHPTLALCVECRTSDDCTDRDALICDTARGECVECITDLHCNEGERCSRGLAKCADPCSDSSDCTDDDEALCDLVLGVCVECLEDADCTESDEPECRRGECRSREDTD